MQKLKCVDACSVSIIPNQPNCVTTNTLYIHDFEASDKLVGGQQPQRIFIRTRRFATGAWALLAQKVVGIFTAMPVTPLDGNSGG